MSSSERLTRRSAIKRGLIAGGALAAGGAAVGEWLARQEDAAGATVDVARSRGAPNILVILVDELRAPQWFQNGAIAAGLMPNLARLRRGGIDFTSHYTAANDCSPARAVLLTGLYSQQTGCLLTSASTLEPEFPTWGSILREHGYETNWYGKWHLTRGDNTWTQANSGALEPYGFSGGTYPSPDGSPGGRLARGPSDRAAVPRLVRDGPRNRPWCTTVSFVNPHDIVWWYRWSRHAAGEQHAPRIVGGLPPNFETPRQMFARRKPRLQHSLQETAQVSFGRVPYLGPQSGTGVAALHGPVPEAHAPRRLADRSGARHASLEARDRRQHRRHLHLRPRRVRRLARHARQGRRGLRGGASRTADRARLRAGLLAAAPSKPRTALTSSVDVVPMLLTIATGSNAWRREARYSHIARRLDMARMLTDPRAPGRPFVVHCTDELVTEFAIEPYSSHAPLHVTAIRTSNAKYAMYSNWRPSTNTILAAGQESELYDYSTRGGRLEIDNRAGRSKLEQGLRSHLEAAVREELRGPLPSYLQAAQEDGYADYYMNAQAVAVEATNLRRKIEESEPPSRGADKRDSH